MSRKILFGSLAQDYIADSGRDIKTVTEEIAKAVKISANQFSKWKAGNWTYIPEKKLLRIIDEISGRDRQRVVNLMIAYLVDQTPEPMRHLLDITPRVGKSDTTSELSGERWSPSLRAKLESIGRAYGRDEDFMKMADQLGKWAETINRRSEKH